MKYSIIVFLLAVTSAYGQLTLDMAGDSTVRKFHLGQYSYHEQFKGYKGYGAPLILTADGGAAAFGNGDEGIMLVKLTNEGRIQWKRTIKPLGDESEAQSVVQDRLGNYYVFILVHDRTKGRAGCERVIFFNKTGTVVWEKFLDACSLLNNPTVSYIRSLSDGRIALRGHVVTEKPAEGKDPRYHFWEGWLNSKGILTQKKGSVIDWSNKEWEKKFRPE